MHLEGVKNAYRRVLRQFEISERLRRNLVNFQTDTLLTAAGARIDLDRNHDRGAGLA